ncbi:MAG: LCP family protein [Anaerotignaceae bacterium]
MEDKKNSNINEVKNDKVKVEIKPDGKSHRKRLVTRFALIVAISVVLYSVVAVAGVFIYGVTRPVTTMVTQTSITKDDVQVAQDTQANQNNSATQETTQTVEEKKRTNVVVFGTDADGFRTDVIFVVNFDAETGNINLLSVPRDTKVTMTDDMIADLKERNRTGFIPSQGNYGGCKINEIHAYAGEGYRNAFSVEMVETLLGIDIDYYVKFSTSGFRYFVDAIGGVEFNVPTSLKYTDPEQGLYINLKAGLQTLDGDKAEQLVRYRDGYAAKDLKRIEVQQQFMAALTEQVLNSEALLSNIVPLTKTLMSCVETDATIMDALKYVKYIDEISMDKIRMETIPGKGGSYFNHDVEGTKALVQEMFFENNQDDQQNQQEVEKAEEQEGIINE